MFLSTVVLGATTVWTADAQQSLGHLQTIYGWTSKVVFDGAYVIFGLVDTDSYLLTFDSGTRRSDVDTWNNNVDSATRARAIVTPFSGPISGMSALDGFLYVVESNAPKRICKFDYLSGAQIWRVPHSTSSHDDSITDLVVSSNGVYTSSVDGTIKQWNITNGDLVAVVQTAIGPNGFFSPIRNLFLNRITNRLYASFGRYVKSDGVGRATLLPSGDFEGLSAEDVFYTAGGSLGMQNGFLHEHSTLKYASGLQATGKRACASGSTRLATSPPSLL